MKNKFLTLLTVTMIAGSMLVGCGGSETENGANTNTETNVNLETESNDATTEKMSEEAIEILEKIRQGVADENARKAAYLEENEISGSYNTETLEAESSEGLELYAPVVLNIGDEEAIANMVKTITLGNNGNYTQYYLEYVDTTDTYVEFNLYLK